MKPSTFSIVARDSETGDLGVAVQSKFLAVGVVVPFAAAGVGAIATQALCNVTYGPDGLRLLAADLSAEETLARLLATDSLPERRQVGIVDARGRTAAHTGSGCMSWAGSAAGPGFTCQGNILVSEATVAAMADVMLKAELLFPERLVAALAAGQSAGGDSRGQQSAALTVVRHDGGYGRMSDRYIDLRVDDHEEPLGELRRLLELHRLYFERPSEADILLIDNDLTAELIQRLQTATRTSTELAHPGSLAVVLERWMGVENLEERLLPAGQIDRRVLEVLRARTS